MGSALALAVAAALLLAPAAPADGPFAHGCPAEALPEGGLEHANRNAASRHVLVPAGPVQVQLCRYWGFAAADGTTQTKETQARVGDLRDRRTLRSPELVRSLATEFNGLELASNRPTSCPMDEGARMYAVFRYADQPPVPVEVHLSGCQFAANGRAERARWMSPPLRRWLERLLSRTPGTGPARDVHEKEVVTRPPPPKFLPFARGKRRLEAFGGEICDSECSSWRLRGCERVAPDRVACDFSAVLLNGETCKGRLTAEIQGTGASWGEACPSNLFLPPEARDHFKEVQEEAERERERETAKRPA